MERPPSRNVGAGFAQRPYRAPPTRANLSVDITKRVARAHRFLSRAAAGAALDHGGRYQGVLGLGQWLGVAVRGWLPGVFSVAERSGVLLAQVGFAGMRRADRARQSEIENSRARFSRYH